MVPIGEGKVVNSISLYYDVNYVGSRSSSVSFTSFLPSRSRSAIGTACSIVTSQTLHHQEHVDFQDCDCWNSRALPVFPSRPFLPSRHVNLWLRLCLVSPVSHHAREDPWVQVVHLVLLVPPDLLHPGHLEDLLFPSSQLGLVHPARICNAHHGDSCLTCKPVSPCSPCKPSLPGIPFSPG